MKKALNGLYDLLKYDISAIDRGFGSVITSNAKAEIPVDPFGISVLNTVWLRDHNPASDSD